MRGPLEPEDEEGQRQLEIAADLKSRQETDDLRWLMGHAQGRRIVTRIIEKAGTRASSFNSNGSTMAFNEGRREIGLWLEREVWSASSEAYLKMLKEHST